MDESAALEKQALALWNQYGFFLPKAHKEFLVRLAALLNWHQLSEALK